jgi:3-oxoacyl-[acyl-carrier-protein] synthase II
MNDVRILGLGPVLVCGQGVEALEKALSGGGGLPAAGVPTDSLTGFLPPARIRRIDPLGRMALLACFLALRDAGIAPEEACSDRMGIVFGTAFGPQTSTFAYLDGIIDAGDQMVSSLAFTNSVHNLAAAQISLALGIIGPARTLTTFGYTVGGSLLSARHWIRSGRVDRVLVVLGEETSPVMTYAVSRMGGGSDGVRPFTQDCSYTARPGCIALVLGLEAKGYARLVDVEEGLTVAEAAERAGQADGLFCADSGRTDESIAYREMAAKSLRVASHGPLYGSLAISLGIELAIAALAITGKAAGPTLKTAAVAGVSGPDRVTMISIEG